MTRPEEIEFGDYGSWWSRYIPVLSPTGEIGLEKEVYEGLHKTSLNLIHDGGVKCISKGVKKLKKMKNTKFDDFTRRSR